MGKMMVLLYELMMLAGVVLVVVNAIKYERGTLTARWFFSMAAYTLCMGAMIYMI